MAHIHNVIDTDKHFIIDAVTMTIQNTSDKVKLSQYNHKSERFTFEIPRYIEGHDMSLCNKVQVHFNNVKSDKTVTSKGVYEVDDLEVAEDENTVLFTWLISRKATLNEGTLNFCIRFACVDEDATVEYARYTDIYKGITISESLFNSEHIIEDYSDILEAWKKELEELAASGGNNQGVIQADHSQNDPTQPDYIKNRLAYYDRKFEDMEQVEYPEPITAYVIYEDEESNEKVKEDFLIKFADLPENATVTEFIKEINGVCLKDWDKEHEVEREENIRFDDPYYAHIKDAITYEDITDEEGNIIGSVLLADYIPYGAAINSDNVVWEWHLKAFDDEEGLVTIGIFPMYFPEKGLYCLLNDIEYDENGNIVDYKTFNKIFFGGVKTIDKEFLPSEVLNPTIKCNNHAEPNSYLPITSNAVHNVKTVLEMSKQDYIYVGYEAYNGYIVATVNGKLQVVSPESLGLGGFNFNPDSVWYVELKNEMSMIKSHADQPFYVMEPILFNNKLDKAENEGKIVAVVNGKLDLVDINDLIGGGANA